MLLGSVRTVDWGLTRQLLEHLGGSRQSVTRLADGDVQDQLLDAQLTHRVAAAVLAALLDNILAIGLLLRRLALGLQYMWLVFVPIAGPISFLDSTSKSFVSLESEDRRHLGAGERLTIVLVSRHVLAGDG